MKILITAHTVIKGKGAVLKGSRHEVDQKIATDLFVAGKAVPAPDAPIKPTTRRSKTVKK